MKTVLETPRLLLRELGLDDLDFVASMLAHPQVMRFYPKCCSRGEAEAWVRRQQDRYVRDGHGFWLVLEKAASAPVGQAGLVMAEIEGRREPGLGYLVHRPFWGRGFATEAAATCLDHAFGALGRSRVVCPIRPDNVASRRVAEKIGMTVEKRVLYAGFEHLLFTLTRQ